MVDKQVDREQITVSFNGKVYVQDEQVRHKVTK